jgi:Leucine-rich repeat (LRR) protein
MASKFFVRLSLIIIPLCFFTGIPGEAKAQEKTIKVLLRDGTVMKAQPSMDYDADHLELGDDRQVERSKVSLLCFSSCKGVTPTNAGQDLVVLRNGRRKFGTLRSISNYYSTDEKSSHVELDTRERSLEEIFFGDIRYIKLSDRVFYSLEQAARAPKMATRLVIRAYELGKEDLSPDLWKLTNLRELDLRFQEDVNELPKEIGNLRWLESLSIYGGSIAMIPESIGQLKNLRVLALNHALAKKVPKEITYLRNLQQLDLENNSLDEIPSAIASLYNLKRLKLTDNNLREIPAPIGNLKNLRELSLNANHIVDLPRSLATIKGLKVYMGNNALKLKDQEKLQKRFPNIVFDFDDDRYDDTANEHPPVR